MALQQRNHGIHGDLTDSIMSSPNAGQDRIHLSQPSLIMCTRGRKRRASSIMTEDGSNASPSDVDTGDDEAPLNVLDLPQIAYQPTYVQLLEALKRFKVKPPSWLSRIQSAPISEQERKSHARYLTSLISNDLSWMTDVQRSRIHEIASRRLSERCGRAGAPAMTRSWKINEEVTLKIHEPPLTGDNLGLKTWASSYLLAKRLELIGAKHKIEDPKKDTDDGEDTWFALELGSGTGLLGLAAAAVWRCCVTLSDLSEIIPNLTRNVDNNLKMIDEREGWATTMELDWEDPPYNSSMLRSFRVIIAADPLYSPTHAPILAKVVDIFLTLNSDARVIIELPYRDEATMEMAENLRTEMRRYSFILIEQGEEFGYDDWEKNGESASVRCWWGIWTREQVADEEAWKERLRKARRGE